MIRKIFVVMIVGLLVISSQIASAAPPIDWSKVQRISSKSDLAKYIESQRKAEQLTIPVIFTNGLTVTNEEFLNLCPSSVISQDVVYNDGQNTRVIFTLMDYPGTKVANAYSNGSTIWLNDEEKRLYNVAVKIVNEAKNKSGYLNQEYYIHNYIMNNVTGDNNSYSKTTAIGALLYGKANCQGYSDAFYMLGTMLGWNVGRMGGTVDGIGHQWNTIDFGDGKVYCVDVTLNDAGINNYGNSQRTLNAYVYFNAPVEIMEITHSWDRALEPPNLQPSVDNCYSYCFLDSHLARANNVEAGLNFIAQKFKERNGWASVMVPFDAKYSDNDVMKTAIYNKVCKECNKNISYRYWQRGKYMLIHTRTY